MDGARVATSRAIVERHRRARFLRASSHRARRTTSPGCGRPTTRHGATSPVIAWLWRCSIWCRPYRPSCLRRKHSTGCSIRPSPTVNSIPCSGAGASTLSSLSIAPTESERTVNLVEDCPELLGCVWREADVSQTDLETVIIDLMAGEYRDPRRVVAFNVAEHWSEDVSEEVARDIQRRSDLTFNDVSSALQAFVDRHAGREKQLALRLV